MVSKYSLVASMDLLGATKAIEDSESNAENYFNRFAKVAHPILKGFGRNIPELTYYTFSDSLFVVAPLDPDELNEGIVWNFGSLMSRLMSDCLLKDIALCGGISAGWVIEGTNPTLDFQSFVVGKALIEAHYAQEEWDWVGIGFAPPTMEHRRKLLYNSILGILKRVKPPLVHKYNIPIKLLNEKTCKKDLRGFIETHAIAWPTEKYNELSDALEKQLEASEDEPYYERYLMTKEYIDTQMGNGGRKNEPDF